MLQTAAVEVPAGEDLLLIIMRASEVPYAQTAEAPDQGLRRGVQVMSNKVQPVELDSVPPSGEQAWKGDHDEVLEYLLHLGVCCCGCQAGC